MPSPLEKVRQFCCFPLGKTILDRPLGWPSSLPRTVLAEEEACCSLWSLEVGDRPAGRPATATPRRIPTIRGPSGRHFGPPATHNPRTKSTDLGGLFLRTCGVIPTRRLTAQVWKKRRAIATADTAETKAKTKEKPNRGGVDGGTLSGRLSCFGRVCELRRLTGLLVTSNRFLVKNNIGRPDFSPRTRRNAPPKRSEDKRRSEIEQRPGYASAPL